MLHFLLSLIAAEIRFERPSYTFRENDGNGDIMVVLDGNVITEVRATVFEISGK